MDFAQICEWAKEYDTTYEDHQFPETGFIVDGLAAYFLYSTDSSVCFLENLISNKLADKVARGTAIKLVIDAVLTEAKRMGFRVAYATTNIPAVIFKARVHGAHTEPNQTLITKKLNSDPS